MKFSDLYHSLLLAILVLFCMAQRGACSKEEDIVEEMLKQNEKWTKETDDGNIDIEIFQQGEDCERKAQEGDILVVKYQAMMPISGVEFDNSAHKTRPFHFTLGEERVMKAWEIGLEGMCIGEQRSLTIPPGPLQKGDKGSGAMIPHDDEQLIYVFELLAIRDTPPPINMFKEMDSDGDNAIQKEEMREWLEETGMEGEQLEGAVENLYSNLDRDMNGVITQNEFPHQSHDEL